MLVDIKSTPPPHLFYLKFLFSTDPLLFYLDAES